VTERRLGQQAPAARRATVEPGHLGIGASLVDENELVDIDEGLGRAPDPAPGGDIRTVLLGRAQCLFLNDSPRRSTADHIAPFESRTACSPASQVCSAARVDIRMGRDLHRQGSLLRRRQFARPITAP